MVLGYSVTQSIKSTLTWYAYNQFNGVRLKRVSEILQTGNVGKQDAGPWGGETKYMVTDLVLKLWDRGWDPILSRNLGQQISQTVQREYGARVIATFQPITRYEEC